MQQPGRSLHGEQQRGKVSRAHVRLRNTQNPTQPQRNPTGKQRTRPTPPPSEPPSVVFVPLQQHPRKTPTTAFPRCSLALLLSLSHTAVYFRVYFMLPTCTSPNAIPIPTFSKHAARSCIDTSAMSARLSSAALFPMSGTPPAPSPRVTSFPICNVLIDSGTRLIAYKASRNECIIQNDHSAVIYFIHIIRTRGGDTPSQAKGKTRECKTRHGQTRQNKS